MTALILGLANYSAAKVSKLGIDALYAEWIGALIPPLAYHLYGFLSTKYKGEQYFVWQKSIYVIEV